MSHLCSTPTDTTRKRNLSSPFEKCELKKSKAGSPTALADMPTIEETSASIDSSPNTDQSAAKVSLSENDLAQIGGMLERTFEISFDSKLTSLVATVVEQVMSHVSPKIATLEKENAFLKSKVLDLGPMQRNSRRNNLRISGIKEAREH